ncbi:hypothetical protein COO20_20725 [Thalassospira marina]|uniref:Uncharacterized protein n=1 Tax=Thalassospira marina TaxID=2048283 RepID=A0A2N3KJ49_9PROT|nr:hypothetical protein COO20_20725 [Thalassospira marina]
MGQHVHGGSITRKNWHSLYNIDVAAMLRNGGCAGAARYPFDTGFTPILYPPGVMGANDA